MKNLKIGTRGSALALWQAEHVRGAVKRLFPDVNPQIIKIKTTGDRILERELHEIGGKGVFVKEIEDSLLSEDIDIAVHSLKDLPAAVPGGLKIGAFIKRQNPFDVLVSSNNIKLCEHSDKDKIGTGSLRRRAQILNLYPHLNIVPVRGNVDTRVRKTINGELTSVVLAGAGLQRLDMEDMISEIFDSDTMVPAPGQGIIAVECREGDEGVENILSQIDHRETRFAALLERSFLGALGGDCSIPAGCYAEINGAKLNALGVIITPDGRNIIKDRIEGIAEENYQLGRCLAEELLGRGGKDILNNLGGN